MKILLAYDGSRCSDAAIDDLTRAGLPDAGEITVITVAEVWLPPRESPDYDAADVYFERIAAHMREKGERSLSEAETLAAGAADRIRTVLPTWKIAHEATYGSPAWEILSQADEIKPDLIVVGSEGHSAVGRLVLGSVSQKVVTEAHCSVRIARGKIDVDSAPVRVGIAFDVSNGAKAAVDSVAARRWPEGTEVKLFSLLDPMMPSMIGRLVAPLKETIDELNTEERNWIEEFAKEASQTLRNAGLPVTLHIGVGNPKTDIAEKAAEWNADCIFAGANAWGSRIERFLIGSTSAAIAARAHCSVEVVRVPA